MRVTITIFSVLFNVLLGTNVKSGGRLSSEQFSIDVIHYKLDLRVDPYKKTISGEVLIKFKLLKKIEYFEFDLIDSYSISGTILNGMSMSFKHRNNKILIDNPGVLLFKDNELIIKYGGRPPIAKNPPWSGGVTWTLDDEGRNWVGVSCQSVGAHIWFPCKEHPSDKANGAEINISVPDPLMAVSNGLLQSTEKKEGRWTQWKWKTDYPISTYNINFTVGDFEVVEKNGYVLDEPIYMVFYVLPQKSKNSLALLDEAESHLNFYARVFGQYPWINEKFGLVHTPFSGMEHQTINAYGNNFKKTTLGYDFILFHEMGHEWWGNYLSVLDWSDFWIHEGIDTYAEAIYVEEKFGNEALKNFVKNRFKKNITNKYPVIPPKNSTAENIAGNDVYYKAAYGLHMIRYLVGKEVLWNSLKEFLHMPKDFVNNQTNTKEFISLINENSGQDLNWFFEQYFYKESLPTLYIKNRIVKDKNFMDMWWAEEKFKMPVDVQYESFDGIRVKKMNINNKKKTMVMPKESSFIIDPDAWLLFNLVKLDNLVE